MKKNVSSRIQVPSVLAYDINKLTGNSKDRESVDADMNSDTAVNVKLINNHSKIRNCNMLILHMFNSVCCSVLRGEQLNMPWLVKEDTPPFSASGLKPVLSIVTFR